MFQARLPHRAIFGGIIVIVTLILLFVPSRILAQDITPTPTLDESIAELVTFSNENELSPEFVMALIMLPIVVIAAASEAIGQCYVLFANRVRPFRFVLTIFINILIFVAGFFVTVTAVWLIGRFIFSVEDAAILALIAVGVSYYPLWFGFLSVLPYFGSYIVLFLYFLVYLQLAQNLIQLNFTVQEAIIAAMLSLVMVYVTRTTIGRPIMWLVRKLRNVVAGTRLERSVEDALRYHGDLIIDRPESEAK